MKLLLYKSLIRSVLIYASESLALSLRDDEALRVFEKKILVAFLVGFRKFRRNYYLIRVKLSGIWMDGSGVCLKLMLFGLSASCNVVKRLKGQVSWIIYQHVPVLFKHESRYLLESNSADLEEQLKIVKRHKGGLGRDLFHTDLHIFYGDTLSNVRYRDEILHQYAAAIGYKFILMDDIT
ncbi:hypothetical protein TNCV_1115301 [Trichonephila clavipes]|nr:hypothetical protein TNCV_1115301 [Trichonephila clavipes]